jgi:hypothetical protein
MKIKTLRYPILFSVIFFFQINSIFSQYLTQRYFTRGADTAEIYLSCNWYADTNGIIWHGIFRSTDNGQTLSVQRKTNSYVEGSWVFGDSVSGALFQAPIHLDTFAISFDYGVTFEKKYAGNIYEVAGGCMAGEIYFNGYGLYRGTDYGNTFTLQSNNDSLRLQDVGTLPGELYMMNLSTTANPIQLAYSNDFGHTFSRSQILLPGIPASIDECDIHRGTMPGEMYILAWKGIDSIAIFHSNDYGQTITLQSYRSKIVNQYDEIFCTAGRTPGSFYFARSIHCGSIPGDHACLWMDYSRDYGVTFTSYYHELDSTYTGVNHNDDLSELKVFPNPANDHVTFRIADKVQDCDSKIVVCDLVGKPILVGVLPKGRIEVTFDTKNLAAGFYCYKITPIINFNSRTISSGFPLKVDAGKIIIAR